MRWSHLLFPDAQRAQIERLRFSILPLLVVEARQPIEQVGHLGMLRSQLLLADSQSAQVKLL